MQVNNGMDAIKVAKSEHVDIVLLDRVLPDINGNEVCRWLKLNRDTMAFRSLCYRQREPQGQGFRTRSRGRRLSPKPFDENELNARIYVRLRCKNATGRTPPERTASLRI